MAAKTAKAPAQAAPAANKAEIDSLQVSLPQMLDLALGTPEVGAVNLNILHNFLHVLLHQIDLRSTKVEYRGDDANRIKTMVSSLKAGPALHLHEYSITDGSGKVEQRARNADNVNVDVVTDAKKGEAHAKQTTGIKQKVGPETEGERQTVIFVEPIVDGVAPTALGFKQLEQSVNRLQERFQALEELSTNPELLERLKGKITDPLTDMWQIINITKRLDASEKGIDKLTTMVQDVFKGDANVAGTPDTSNLEKRLADMESNISKMEETINNLQIIANVSTEEEVKHEEHAGPGEKKKTDNEATMDTAHKETGGTHKTGGTDGTPKATNRQSLSRISITQLLGGVDIGEMQKDVTALKTEMAQIRTNMYNVNEQLTVLSEKRKVSQPEVAPGQHTTDKETVEAQKEKDQEQSEKPDDVDLTRCIEAVKNAEMMQVEAQQKVNERIDKLEKDVTCLMEIVNGPPMAGAAGSAELDQLVSKIQGIQTNMDKLNQTAERLIDDRENREINLNALLEQIELLKTIKADKEDLEDALADKADAQVLNRKVSHDQFDAACDDLARGLEDAISKLGKQESIWQEALDEVQKEIEGKVDKIEISPLRDFVNNRLKYLQEKLKNLAELKREHEAAGTKKLLRDVQCISCDQNVVMKMEEGGNFRADPLPCTMSMKPYLTYELDKVRKQQRRLPHSRNMLLFEAALQEETKKQRSARTESLVKTSRDHLCNRYCGGSHTVTTPHQRVMRLGHALNQWGPQTLQLTEGVARGTDGKMYRSRGTSDKFTVCGLNYEEQIQEECRVALSDRPAPVAGSPRKSIETERPTSTKKQGPRKSSKEHEAKETVTNTAAERSLNVNLVETV